MKKQTVLLTAILSGLLAFSAGSYAGPDSDKKGGKAHYSQMTDAEKSERMEKRLNRMADKLGLSDEQKTQVQALKVNSKNEMKPLRLEKRAIRTEMKSLDTSAADYSAKLADIANRKAENVRQMVIAKGNQRKQMATILTTEQMAKLKEMKSKRKGKFHKKKRGGKKH